MNTRGLLILGLLVSAGINLFLVGILSTRTSDRFPIEQARPLPPNLRWLIRDLEETRQRDLVNLIQPLAAESASQRRALMTAQREVNRLMSASDFDAEALTKAFADLRLASDAYGAKSHAQTVAVLNELTASERRSAQDFIARRGPREGRPRIGGPRADEFRPPSPAERRARDERLSDRLPPDDRPLGDDVPQPQI
jgi:Spy/CpxP family protein refolding chaperone